MTVAESLFIAAACVCGLAVLPGSLGVLTLTNTLAAGTRGARLIHGRAGIILMASAVVLISAIYQGASADGFSALSMAAISGYAGILAFGYLMHTSQMFKPVRKPRFISMAAAIKRFGPDEEVIGVTDRGGQPFALVTRLARRPHIVHQPDGKTPFVMTHCILSHSSMGYAAKGSFGQPEFWVAGALANNLVIYDSKNDCAISQIQGRSRDDTLAPTPLPTVATSLKSWQALYPDSTVWVRPITWRDAFFLKVLSRGDIINPESPKLVYPLQRPPDPRLGLKSMVVGVRVGEAAKAYPLSLFKHRRIINDTIGNRAVVIASAFDGDYIQVFDRDLDGTTLTFREADNGAGFTDVGTESTFAPHGRCISGAFEGRWLRAIPHFNKIFWFPWVDYFPNTEIYSIEVQARGA